MTTFGKEIDATFHGAGIKPGLEIWCIENLQLFTVSRSMYGRFFSGNSYLVLNTVLLKSGLPQHAIHYWLGKDATELDSAFASDKAVELDSALGSQSVQYREIQGNETEKFLSYFKPCFIPNEGVFSSERGHMDDTYKISLLSCKGDHVVHMNEVPFSRSSLNHNEVFILDTEYKLFLFSGCNSTVQERAKALEVIQYMKDNKHGGRCEVATIEDGKFVGDSDAGEFWSLFGGYAPISRDSSCTITKDSMNLPQKLFWISKSEMIFVGVAPLKRKNLCADKCYMLDCSAQIFIWMGRNTSLTERKASITATEVNITSQGRSSTTHITFLTEGYETAAFKSCFDDWSQTAVRNLYEEGRGKVAEIFKKQGFDVKELPDEDQCNDAFIDCSGFLKVWRVDCHDVCLVSVSEHGRLFSGDCYIVQYTYPGNERDEFLFYAWIGCRSIMEDRIDAITFMCSMVDSIKGHPVMAQIFEEKEPVQFLSIFQKLIIFKGGMSSGYKNSIHERGNADETCNGDKAFMFRVQGSTLENMQAIQVDPVSSALNSSYCYILQTNKSIYTWVGNLSTVKDHDLLDRMLDLLYPTQQITSIKEGCECETFWDSIGGKAEYSREKEINKYDDDPHLFTCTFAQGDLKVKEIFNYTQDDLTTEEVLILDCCSEIFVWIGQHSNISSKQQALTLGKKYLEADILLQGLSLETAIYVVTEGYEPSFFTRFFHWDSSKALMQGNSFERKLAILKGSVPKLETPRRGSKVLYGTRYSESPATDSSGKLVISDRLRARSGTPAAQSFTPTSTDTQSRRMSCPAPVVRKLFTVSPPHLNADAPLKSPNGTEDFSSDLEKFRTITVSESEVADANGDLEIFPYERLKVTSENPITGIDITKREAYLSNAEFQEKFGMTKRTFYELPEWRRRKLKMDVSLF